MEVGIEGKGLLDAQAFHHRKIESIHQGEVLVPVLCNDSPGVFQVLPLRHHELHRPGKKEIPELQGCIPAEVMGDKEPALKENIIRGDKLLFPDELLVNLLSFEVVPIACIGLSIKGRGVNEGFHRKAPGLGIHRVFRRCWSSRFGQGPRWPDSPWARPLCAVIPGYAPDKLG